MSQFMKTVDGLPVEDHETVKKHLDYMLYLEYLAEASSADDAIKIRKYMGHVQMHVFTLVSMLEKRDELYKEGILKDGNQ